MNGSVHGVNCLSVLVTRPPPGLDETMQALRARGHVPIAAPLLRVRLLSPAVPARVQAILLTSGQAAAPLAAVAPHLLDSLSLAVGDRTAARARQAGFACVRSAAGDADDLAGLAATCCRPRDGLLLLACGIGQGRSLSRALRGSGFRVARRCVYAAAAVRRLPGPARAALDPEPTLDAALFFSRDTAAAFARLLPRRLRQALARTRALAISDAAAEPLRALGWRSIETAAAPTAEALLLRL